jgi:hypothetical protein
MDTHKQTHTHTHKRSYRIGGESSDEGGTHGSRTSLADTHTKMELGRSRQPEQSIERVRHTRLNLQRQLIASLIAQ